MRLPTEKGKRAIFSLPESTSLPYVLAIWLSLDAGEGILTLQYLRAILRARVARLGMWLSKSLNTLTDYGDST